MSSHTASTFTLPSSSRKISYAIDEPATPSTPKRTVILANSLCAPLATWDHVVPRLTSLGLTVLRYDQPGHGSSSVPEDLSSTTFRTIATDVHDLISHLGLANVHAWVGVSMGAATGVFFAGMFPGVVSRLVVADTISSSAAAAGGEDVFGPRVKAAKKEGGMEKLIEGTLKRWFGEEWMAKNPTETERMRSLMLGGVSVEGFETCCAALQDPGFDLRGDVAEAAGGGVERVLLVVGEKDANLPWTMRDSLMEGIQMGQWEKYPGESTEGGFKSTVGFKVIKDAGHVCYIDGLEEFIAVVGEFVAASEVDLISS